MTFEELAKIYVNLRETETVCSIWRREIQDEISRLPQDKQDELEKLFIDRLSLVNNLQPGKITARWKKIEQAIRNLSEPKDVWVLIEKKESSKPLLLVCFDSGQYLVDVIQSIKDNISNISHPLVIWFIKQYARACTSPSPMIPNPEIVKKVIGKICNALTKSGELSLTAPPFSYFIKYLAWPPEYFEKAAQLYAEIRTVRNSSEKRRRIREGLKEFPDLDHTKMIEFLENWQEPRLVKPDALRNAFLAYIDECEVQTVKNRLSEANKARRKLDPDNSINEESMQKFIDSGSFDIGLMQRLFGIGVINSEDEIRKSSLVWKERQLESPNDVPSIESPPTDGEK
ncbi:MAG: hypothetical protein JST84_01355 [Acidobacteria bacterium]|nr:hypothetical protein [Acidobacteriota bacterium]